MFLELNNENANIELERILDLDVKSKRREDLGRNNLEKSLNNSTTAATNKSTHN